MSGTIRGGGHVGGNSWLGYRATWPIVSLSITPDAIVFSMWPVKYRFEKASIRYLLKKRVFGWPSLFIAHSNPAYAKSVMFQPFGFSHLESLLTQNDYRITTQEPIDSDVASVKHSNAISIVAYAAAVAGIIAAIVAVMIAIKWTG